MVKALINGIFNVILSVASVFTSPISSAISGTLPQVADAVSSITRLINLILGVIPYFLHLIPPLTRGAIYIVITFWVAQQPVLYVYRGIMQILNLVKRINIFTSK